MPKLVDSSIWIDLIRPKSPPDLKQLIDKITDDPEIVLAEPVIFEVLVYASEDEGRRARRAFETLDILPTPRNLWAASVSLGQRCRAEGVTAGPFDLVIAAIAIHHDAELLTFDGGFKHIAKHSRLRLNVLSRPD
jgi:predicted nucleic acid-binding protein